MGNGQLEGSGVSVPRRDSVNLATWFAAIFLGHATGMAALAGLAAAILKIPVHGLLVPYIALACCGLVLAPSLYWARLSRERPDSCAIRFGVGMFLYLQALMLALGFGAVRVGIISRVAAIHGFAPLVIPFSALASVLLYVAARQVLKAPRPR